MSFRFKRHYTRDEAQALLPEVRGWLEQLAGLRRDLDTYDQRLTSVMAQGADTGGNMVNTWVKTMARMQALLLEFYRREIQVKDLDRGLIDFPALIGGKEVFLCWEQGEPHVEFWHDLDSGYAGRERI